MRWLCLLGLFAACAGLQSGGEPAPRPHVIWIIADDLGYADLGFTGCVDIPTPNLDRLAQAGVVCTDGHVSASVCAPSRAGLITGRYQQRFGFECNLGSNQKGLLPDVPTAAQLMGEAGYECVGVGKWHLGYAEENHPLEVGFEHFTGLRGGSRSYFPKLDKRPSKAQRIERDRVEVPESEFSYLTDLFTEEACRLVVERDEERPLFMYLSYTAPHGPMHAREDLFESFSGIEVEKRQKYAAMVAAMDEGVGRLLSTLDAEGMTEDTMVVFLSDNGGATNNASDNGAWRGMKGSKWEGGQRVPFVISWPGALGSGRYDEAISSLDLLPTALSVAGAEAPEELDGVDLMPFIGGGRGGSPHEALYWRRFVAAAVREGDWKFVRVREADDTFRAPILVNLALDPGELIDRAGDEPARVARMQSLLEGWESGLSEPRWQEAEVWQNNQRKKHEMGLLGREAERRLP